jgi:hypothetical protein
MSRESQTGALAFCAALVLIGTPLLLVVRSAPRRAPERAPPLAPQTRTGENGPGPRSAPPPAPERSVNSAPTQPEPQRTDDEQLPWWSLLATSAIGFIGGRRVRLCIRLCIGRRRRTH